MPVIYKEKVEYAYTDPGVKAHTLSWAEYQALPTAQKMNGDLYFIPDKQPEGNPSRIWDKLGTEPLDTEAQDVSGAVNELNAGLSNVQQATIPSPATGTFRYVQIGRTVVFSATINVPSGTAANTSIASGLPLPTVGNSAVIATNNNAVNSFYNVILGGEGTLRLPVATTSSVSLRITGSYITAS